MNLNPHSIHIASSSRTGWQHSGMGQVWEAQNPYLPNCSVCRPSTRAFTSRWKDPIWIGGDTISVSSRSIGFGRLPLLIEAIQ